MLKLTATVGIATAFLAQPISAQAAAVSSKMAGRVRDERYFGIDKTDHAIVTRGRRKDNGTKQAIVDQPRAA
jgi:hypothetical protein